MDLRRRRRRRHERPCPKFGRYVQSWIFLLGPQPNGKRHHRFLEMAGLLLFASWVVTVALSMPTWTQTGLWLLVSHASAGLLHVQITISHWAMHTYSGHAYNDETDEWCAPCT